MSTTRLSLLPNPHPQLQREYRWNQALHVASYIVLLCMIALLAAVAMAIGIELHAIAMTGVIVVVSAGLIGWGDQL